MLSLHIADYYAEYRFYGFVYGFDRAFFGMAEQAAYAG